MHRSQNIVDQARRVSRHAAGFVVMAIVRKANILFASARSQTAASCSVLFMQDIGSASPFIVIQPFSRRSFAQCGCIRTQLYRTAPAQELCDVQDATHPITQHSAHPTRAQKCDAAFD
jgi:hypothetical protein